MRPTTIIQRVRQIMAEGPNTSTQDGATIAEAYCGLCKQANERLRGCVDCLKKGMISEALRIAETEPSLLDLCGDLDFVGVENWLALCAERNWAKPESIDGKSIQSLNEAYSSGQALEPLLKEFRRAVRERKTKESVRLLRHIAGLDKANPNWITDLKGFEERRLAEIKNEFEKARLADDAESLAALMVEINDDWITPRDQALKDSIRNAARGVYEKQAMAVGRTRLQKVANAYAALDFDRLASAVEMYDLLLREGYLKPDAAMITQYDEAKEWLQQETKVREEERVYTETLANLRAAVEKGNAKPLDEILNILTRFNRPIPDRLEERAMALIETQRLAMERVHKRRIATAAIVLILVASGIAAIVYRQRFNAEKEQLIEALVKTYQSEDLAGLNKLLVRAEIEEVRVFHDPEIQVWVQKKTQLESLLEKKRSAFDQGLSRLEAIREEGYKQSAQVVEGLIAEVRANVTPGAAQGRLAAFLREWSAHNDAMHAEIDKQASTKIDELALEVEAMAHDANQNAGVTRDRYIAARDKGLRVSQEYEKASPEQKARWGALIARLDGLINELDAKERQLSVISEAKSLREYVDALKTYARAFPNDLFSKPFGIVLAQEASYTYLLESPGSCISNNPFWFDAYRQQIEFSTRSQENWAAIKTTMMDLDAEQRYTGLWECDAINGKVFIEGKPSEGFARGFKVYQGMMFIPTIQDVQPEFKQQTLEANTVIRASLMPHCEFVQGLVSMARFTNPSSAYDDLIGEMQKLSTNNNITPLLKLRLMDMLLGCLTDLVGEDLLSEWKTVRHDIKSVDAELHWLCILHRDVIRANKEADAILKRYFTPAVFIKQSRFMSAVRNASLQRNVKWVAYAGLTNATQVVWKTGTRSAEVWVVRLSEEGVPQIILAGETQANGMIQYINYIPGEPIYAPTDGRLTREILASLKQKHDLRETKQLKWVNSWPANFRQ